MKTLYITAKYEIAEALARTIRELYQVIGESTRGKREPDEPVTKRLYIDDRASTGHYTRR